MKRYSAPALDREAAKFKFFQSDSGTVKVSGYASVFDVVDMHGDVVDRGAFSAWLATEPRIPLRYEHQLPNIGLVTALQEDGYGLLFEAELTPNHSVASDVAAELKHGTVTGVSFGAFWERRSLRSEGDVRHLTALEPFEISLTSTPANRAARIIDIKSAIDDAASLAEIEGVLRDAGTFSRAEATALVSRIRTIVRGDRAPSETSGNEVDGAAIRAAFEKFKL